MKMNLLFGGLLIGLAIGLMVGGAVVKVPADGAGKREYPQGVALLLTMVGSVAVANALRMAAT